MGEILGRSAARHPGLVIGVRADGETGVWSRGVDPGAVFEIGSITKTFTATLLALMVRDGQVSFDDPVADHLPVAPPVVGRPITLVGLATHRSGLPRLPSGMLVQGYTSARKDHYASLDDARMRRAIAETKPKRAPGGKFAYSNHGYGLLGYALAQRAGTSFGELVRDRITGPLGLRHTALDTPGLTQGMGSSAAPLSPGVSPRSPARAVCARPRSTCSRTSRSTPPTRARQPGSLGERPWRQGHASAVTWSTSTRSSAPTSSGGANR